MKEDKSACPLCRKKRKELFSVQFVQQYEFGADSLKGAADAQGVGVGADAPKAFPLKGLPDINFGNVLGIRREIKMPLVSLLGRPAFKASYRILLEGHFNRLFFIHRAQPDILGIGDDKQNWKR